MVDKKSALYLQLPTSRPDDKHIANSKQRGKDRAQNASSPFIQATKPEPCRCNMPHVAANREGEQRGHNMQLETLRLCWQDSYRSQPMYCQQIVRCGTKKGCCHLWPSNTCSCAADSQRKRSCKYQDVYSHVKTTQQGSPCSCSGAG